MGRIVLFLFIAASGCVVEEPPPPYEGTSSAWYDVRLWVEPTLSERTNAILEGCAVWEPEGFHCRLVESDVESNLPIRYTTAPCAGKRRRLATQHEHGIDVTACGLAPHIDFPYVLGHEFGHWFGHEPAHLEECPGEGLCGVGIMNPTYREEAFLYLTTADHEWFMAGGGRTFWEPTNLVSSE